MSMGKQEKKLRKYKNWWPKRHQTELLDLFNAVSDLAFESAVEKEMFDQDFDPQFGFDFVELEINLILQDLTMQIQVEALQKYAASRVEITK